MGRSHCLIISLPPRPTDRVLECALERKLMILNQHGSQVDQKAGVPLGPLSERLRGFGIATKFGQGPIADVRELRPG